MVVVQCSGGGAEQFAEKKIARFRRNNPVALPHDETAAHFPGDLDAAEHGDRAGHGGARRFGR